MWCILINGEDFADVVGPFVSAQEAATYVGERLILKPGSVGVVMQMSDPTLLNRDGFKVR